QKSTIWCSARLRINKPAFALFYIPHSASGFHIRTPHSAFPSASIPGSIIGLLDALLERGETAGEEEPLLGGKRQAHGGLIIGELRYPDKIACKKQPRQRPAPAFLDE